MNDNELDLALVAIGASRTRVSASSDLRARVRAVPLRSAQRHSWLQRPTWRFGSVATATRFVLAGAIVALFGGFLLAGVLTQPSDEAAPAAVGDSPRPVRTDELLSALTTEEVEPGVYRVLGDGERELTRVHDMTVTPEGDVWLEIAEFDWWSLVRLGEPGVTRRLRPDPWDLGLTSDGAPAVKGVGGTRVFDGTDWPWAALSPYEECLLASPAGAVASDGSCWTREAGAVGSGVGLVRTEPDGSRTHLTGAELGLEPGQDHIGSPVVARDGTVWTSVHRTGARGGVFGGLLKYDGSTWSLIPYERDEAENWDYGLSVGHDGAVWIGRALGSDRFYSWLSWDGDTWTDHGAEADAPVIAFDAHRPFVEAPDGYAWTVIGEQLHLITPEALAAAAAAAVEPTEEAESTAPANPDLLPGVHLVTEEVEPGVYRVLSDGAGHDLVGDPPVSVTVGPDGSVVVFGADPTSRYSQDIDTVYVLGQEPSWEATDEDWSRSSESWFDAAVDHDGSLWARLDDPGRLGRHDGLFGRDDTETWASPVWPDGTVGANAIEVAADGAIWVTQRTIGPGPKVARIVDGEWTVLSTEGSDLPVGEYQGESMQFAVGPDRTAWLSTGVDGRPVPHDEKDDRFPPGLLHYDGERWSPVELPVDWRFDYVGPLAVGPDGTLWVYVAEHSGTMRSLVRSDKRLLRLKEGEWTVFDDVPVLTGPQRFGARLAVDADGTLWIAFNGFPLTTLPAPLDSRWHAGSQGDAHGVLSFDGTTWRQYLDRHMVNRVALAEDGSVWATSLFACSEAADCEYGGDRGGGLYVITPVAEEEAE